MARLTVQKFTSSGTWVAPAGITNVILIGQGGGGGGAGGRSNIATFDGGNCGGGGTQPTMLQVDVTPNTSYSITIGAGGTGGVARTNNTFNGGSGGNTTFGALATFKGFTGAQSVNGSNSFGTTAQPYFTWLWTKTTAVFFSGSFYFRSRSAYGENGAWGTSQGTWAVGGAGGCPGFAAGGAGGNAGTATSPTPTAGTAGAANTGAGGGAGGGNNSGTAPAGGAGGSGQLWVCWVE